MAVGFITGNLFDKTAFPLNTPVKVTIIVRQDGDSRPDEFYALAWDCKETVLSLQYNNLDRSRKLDHILIDDVNNNTIGIEIVDIP